MEKLYALYRTSHWLVSATNTAIKVQNLKVRPDPLLKGGISQS